jgi:hypothetical protein
MSISLFRFPPGSFVKHEGVEPYGANPDATRADNRGPKRKTSAAPETEPSLLRDDHIVLLAIDALLALHAAVKRYFAHRRTRQILSALDERQLRDIGLTRSEALCTSDNWRQAGDESRQHQSR